MVKTDADAPLVPVADAPGFLLHLSDDQARLIDAELEQTGGVTEEAFEIRSFDTPDGRLGAKGVSLSLCRRAEHWTQRLGLAGAGRCGRAAGHTVDLAWRRAARAPDIDWLRHREGKVLRQAAPHLHALLRSDPTLSSLQEIGRARGLCRSARVERSGSHLQVSSEAVTLQAGGARVRRRCLHIALLSGDALQLGRLTCRWLTRYGLWLQVESIEEQLHRLAFQLPHPPVAQWVPVDAGPHRSKEGWMRVVMSACARQILGNAAAVAGADFEDEHVHQLRVGLRRQRCALHDLAATSNDLPRRMEGPLAQVFRVLGVLRDRQTVLKSLQPELRSAGAAAAAWVAAHGPVPDVVSTLRAPSFQCALVRGMAYVMAPPGGASGSSQSLRRSLRPILDGLLRRVIRAGRHFERLSEPAQHKARKRLKRLRYLSEFAAPLFDAQRTRRFLCELESAQDALGACNDAAVSRAVARHAARSDRQALHVVMRLEKGRAALTRAARDQLRALASLPPFWR